MYAITQTTPLVEAYNLCFKREKLLQSLQRYQKSPQLLHEDKLNILIEDTDIPSKFIVWTQKFVVWLVWQENSFLQYLQSRLLSNQSTSGT